MSAECIELRKSIGSEPRSLYQRGAELCSRSAATLGRELKRWAQNHRTRNDLAELNDYMLKDIGISRYQAREESAKPFWKI